MRTTLDALQAASLAFFVACIFHYLRMPARLRTVSKRRSRKRRERSERARQEFESKVDAFVADTRLETRVRFEIMQMMIQEGVIFMAAIAAGAAYLAYDHIGQQALAALFWCTMTLTLLAGLRRSRKRFAIEEIVEEAQRRLEDSSHRSA